MRRHNPAVIPRNQHVEAALRRRPATATCPVMTRLLDVLATPYDHDRDLRMFSAPAPGARPTALSAAHESDLGHTVRERFSH